VASEGGPEEHRLARTGAVHVKLPLSSKNPLVIRRNIARLRDVIEVHGVDIVHARARLPAWSALAAARRTGRRFVTTFHGAYAIGNALKRRYSGVLAMGDRVIAPSEFIARHVLSSYRVDPDRLRVIPGGVDLATFDPAKVSSERIVALANRYRLPDGMPVVMLPGRLSRRKGQALLLQALTRLSDVDFCCVLVGPDGARKTYRRELEAMIARNGLSDRAILLEECMDMPAAYMLADVVVSAGTEPEAFGRVIAEAQAMGRPVVASDHGIAPEQVLAGETAFLFAPGDAGALAESLRGALALQAGAREHLARMAMANARVRFSKEQTRHATLAVYRELLEGRERIPAVPLCNPASA
jgi:glycosyltransferase involved in cell wall biosynthesis